MKRTTIVLAVTLALTGCTARYHWDVGTSGANEYKFRLDRAECTNEGNQAYVPIITYPFGGWRIQPAVYQECMEKRGYVKVRDEGYNNLAGERIK